jgi:uncharacterized protein (DUF169 family)
MIGFEERREIVKNGTYRAAIWFESKREGLKCEEEFPHLPAGRFSAAFLGPLRANKFEPDIVLIYGTPAQMIIIINAIQWKDYKRVEVSCTGESSCADYIAGCYLSKKPIVTIPCYGERVYAHTQEDEMVIGIPADQIEKVVNGLQNLSKRGVRYPIPFSGPQLEVVNNLPPLYRDIYGIEDKPLFEFWNDKKVK